MGQRPRDDWARIDVVVVVVVVARARESRSKRTLGMSAALMTDLLVLASVIAAREGEARCVAMCRVVGESTRGTNVK